MPGVFGWRRAVGSLALHAGGTPLRRHSAAVAPQCLARFPSNTRCPAPPPAVRQVLGMRQRSLGYLLQRYCGIKADKSLGQTADWRQRWVRGGCRHPRLCCPCCPAVASLSPVASCRILALQRLPLPRAGPCLRSWCCMLGGTCATYFTLRIAWARSCWPLRSRTPSTRRSSRRPRRLRRLRRLALWQQPPPLRMKQQWPPRWRSAGPRRARLQRRQRQAANSRGTG